MMRRIVTCLFFSRASADSGHLSYELSAVGGVPVQRAEENSPHGLRDPSELPVTLCGVHPMDMSLPADDPDFILEAAVESRVACGVAALGRKTITIRGGFRREIDRAFRELGLRAPRMFVLPGDLLRPWLGDEIDSGMVVLHEDIRHAGQMRLILHHLRKAGILTRESRLVPVTVTEAPWFTAVPVVYSVSNEMRGVLAGIPDSGTCLMSTVRIPGVVNDLRMILFHESGAAAIARPRLFGTVEMDTRAGYRTFLTMGILFAGQVILVFPSGPLVLEGGKTGVLIDTGGRPEVMEVSSPEEQAKYLYGLLFSGAGDGAEAIIRMFHSEESR